MAIAFIGFGEAGGILAADLAREHAVTIWDCKLNGPAREAMGKKARDSRVQVGSSLAQALESATLDFFIFYQTEKFWILLYINL